MNAEQFAWAYLVKNGYGGFEPSYYGGFDVIDTKLPAKIKTDWDGVINAKPLYLDAIKKVGVNWNKTKAPKSTFQSQFNGTFADASLVEFITGTLVLNNGYEQIWYAPALEVSNVFEMMANTSELQDFFNKMFN